MITISLGAVMSEISKTEEETLLGSDDSKPTLWKVHKKIVECRQKGWLKRFAQRLDLGEIALVDPPKNYEEQRIEKMKKKGWEPIQKRFPLPPSRFTEDSLAQVEDWEHKGTNLCYLCWSSVPFGPGRVQCKKCPVVSHHTCVIDARQYKLPVISTKRNNIDVQRQLSQESSEYDKNGVIINWICPLCIQDVNQRNNSCEAQYQKNRRDFEEEFAAIRIQSFARMVKPKADYTRAIVGILILQRMHRARRYWRKAEGEKAKTQLRPFRVRIHSVYVLVNTDKYPLLPSEEAEYGPILASYHHTIGEMTANTYNELMKPDHDAELNALTNALLATSMKSPGSNAGPSSSINNNNSAINSNLSNLGANVGTAAALLNPSLNNAPPAAPSGDSEMLQLLRANHIEVPSFLPPFKLSHGKMVTRGVYFLTVSVQKQHRVDSDPGHDESKQIYRIDSPLKLDNVPIKVTPTNLKKLGIEVDSSLCENCSNLKLFKFTLLKPYILFPASDSNVSLKFVVSQAYIVAENIKSAVVGVSTVPIKNYLVWKRNFSATTGLSMHCQFDDIPSLDEGCRVDLHHKRPPNLMPIHPAAASIASAETAEVDVNASATANTGITGPVVNKKTKRELADSIQPARVANANKLSEEESIGFPISCKVTWSLLTISFDLNDHAGEAFLLAQGFLQASRRKQWLTLIDRVLRVFSTPSDMLPNMVLDMRTAHVAPLDDGIIKIKYRQDNWFLYFTRATDGLEWMRKLYTESLSNDIRKYTPAMLIPKHKYSGSQQQTSFTSSKAAPPISWEEYLGDIATKIVSSSNDDCAPDDQSTEGSMNSTSGSQQLTGKHSSRHSSLASGRRSTNAMHSTRSRPASKSSKEIEGKEKSYSASNRSVSLDIPSRATTSNDNSNHSNSPSSRKRGGSRAFSPGKPDDGNGSSNSNNSNSNSKLPATPTTAKSRPVSSYSDKTTTSVVSASIGDCDNNNAASSVATLPPIKEKVKKPLTIRENTLLNIFVQAAKRFPTK